MRKKTILDADIEGKRVAIKSITFNLLKFILNYLRDPKILKSNLNRLLLRKKRRSKNIKKKIRKNEND